VTGGNLTALSLTQALDRSRWRRLVLGGGASDDLEVAG
jgi:hypothetical protein